MAAGDVGSETALEVRAGADGLLHVNGMTFLRLLGRGSFGEVVLAREDAGGDLVAVKCISRMRLVKSLAGGSTSPARVLTAEVVAPMVLAPLGAAIRLRRVIEDPDADLLYFVMDYADAGVCMTLDSERAVFEARCGAKETTVAAAAAAAAAATVRVYSEAQARCIVRDILTELATAHEAGFVHRDVSPTNVLLRVGRPAVLCDFGVAEAFDVDLGAGWGLVAGSDTPAALVADSSDSLPTTPPRPTEAARAAMAARAVAMRDRPAADAAARPSPRGEEGDDDLPWGWVADMQGSYAFQPPEACAAAAETSSASADDRGFDGRKADVWMLGCTLHCMLTGSQPFAAPGAAPLELFDTIAAFAAAAAAAAGASPSSSVEEGEGDKAGRYYKSPEDVSDACRAFLLALLTPDPSRRPTAREALGHEWLTSSSDEEALSITALNIATDLHEYSSVTLSMLRDDLAAGGDGLLMVRRAAKPSSATASGAGKDAADDASSDSVATAAAAAAGASSGGRPSPPSTPTPPPVPPPPAESGSGLAKDETSLPSVLFQGWLRKRGRLVHSWQSRYLYIRNGVLYYFKSPPVPVTVMLSSASPSQLAEMSTGSMNLDKITRIEVVPKPDKPHRFMIEASGRELWLQPEEGEPEAKSIMERWIRGFKAIRDGGAAADDSTP